MTSALSSPIRIASWRVIGQTSWASGSLVVRGLATFGSCNGKLALKKSACLTSLSSNAIFPRLSWGTGLD